MPGNEEFSPISESISSTMYRTRPSDIKINEIGAVPGSFGKAEIEISAGRLVQFFQSRGYWCSFTIDELARYYTLRGWNSNTIFFGLAGLWFDDSMMGAWRQAQPYIAINSAGACFVTKEFIDRCAGIKK